MFKCESTANRSNSNDQDSWQYCGSRRRWCKTTALLCLCSEVIALTLTGCTQQFRVECTSGVSLVSDAGAISGATTTKIRSKTQPITGTLNFSYSLDDLINQINGAETQISCDYGDAAKWPKATKNELKFTLKPYLEYPLE